MTKGLSSFNITIPMTSTPLPPLGDIILILLKQRGLKAYELGEKVGISPTSVSKIIKGVTRPRQSTFTRICQTLCVNREEEKRLVAAYSGAELLEEEDPAPYAGKSLFSTDSEKEVLRLRAEQFLERKTQAIAFKRSVARELDKLGVRYIADHYEGIYSTDFLVEKSGKRVALECKANLERDIEKAVAISKVIGEKLSCEVLLVVPYSSIELPRGTADKVILTPLTELASNISKALKL